MQISILCVDDNEALLLTRKLVLERNGYHIVTATDAEQARRLFSDEQFDLVILDYFLPGMRGDELCVEFRRSKPSVRVILISGTLPDDNDCGCADSFILKGESPALLLETIASLVSKSA